jgi:hypothetical protein
MAVGELGLPPPVIYNPGDLAVINGLIANNELPWDPTSPADGTVCDPSWAGVTWSSVPTDKRITGLDFTALGVTNAVNLSALAELQTLDFTGNAITSLTVTNLVSFDTLIASNCAALVTLTCNNNALTTLDVHGCAALEYLNCSHNSLSNTHDWTAAAWAMKVLLDASWDGGDWDWDILATFDISYTGWVSPVMPGSPYWFGAPDYKEITGGFNLTGNTALKDLDCGFNNLTALVLYGLPDLETWNANDNPLEYATVSDCPNLRSISIANTPMTTEGDEVLRLGLELLFRSMPDRRSMANGTITLHNVDFGDAYSMIITQKNWIRSN